MGGGKNRVLRESSRLSPRGLPRYRFRHSVLCCLVVLVARVLLGVAHASGPPTPPQAISRSDTLRAGFLIPLSGELSWFGTALRRGLEMAQREGATPLLTAVYEDDQSTNRTAVSIGMRRLIGSERIQIAILTGAPSVIIADPIARHAQVVTLSAIDSNDSIKSLSPFSFGYGWSNELTGSQMATFAPAPSYTPPALPSLTRMMNGLS
jgi:ABC-type branched-subunit amino acid transport system substrate-binding protein